MVYCLGCICFHNIRNCKLLFFTFCNFSSTLKTSDSRNLFNIPNVKITRLTSSIFKNQGLPFKKKIEKILKRNPLASEVKYTIEVKFRNRVTTTSIEFLILENGLGL